MNLAEIRAAVEAYLGDTIVDIDRHVNACLERLASMSEKIDSMDVNVEDGKFVLPEECLILKDVYWENRRLDRWIRLGFDDDVKGDPFWWVQIGNEVKLYPPATGKAEIFYTPRPKKLIQETDVPDLDGCEEALILYAVWRGRMEEDHPSAVISQQNYLDAERQWITANRKRYNRKRKIRLVGE
jgi:hypothetical protein